MGGSLPVASRAQPVRAVECLRKRMRILSGVIRGGERRREPDELVRLVGLPVLALAAAAWLTTGVWGAGSPGGLDTMAHVVRTDFGLREVLGRGHLDGWSPSPGVGSELFLFYGPGLAILTGAVRLASLGILSVPGAFKAVVLGSFLMIPPAMVYLARSFGLSWRASWLGAILALGVSTIYGVGLEGVFVTGLVPHQVATPILLLTLGAIVRLWFDPRPVRVMLVALGSSALILTHSISATILAALAGVVAILLAAERSMEATGTSEAQVGRPLKPAFAGLDKAGFRGIGRNVVMATLAAAALTVGLVAFWLVPFLAHRNLGGASSAWATPTIGVRLREVLDGHVLFRPSVAWFIVAGIVGLLFQADTKQPPRLAIALAPIVYLIAAHLLQRRLPFNVITFQLPNRGIGYAGLLAVLPLAIGLDRLAHRLRRNGTILVAGAAIGIGIWPMMPLRDLARDATPLPAAQKAAHQLQQRVPAHARFAVERHPGEAATALASPPFWLAMMSGRLTVNAFSPETSTAPDPMFVGDSMTSQDPDAAADRLARYGVTHVVMTSDGGRTKFGGSPRFVEVWGDSELSILEVQARPGHPPASSLVSTDAPASALLLRGDPERVLIRVGAPEPVTATLAMAWSPKWRAELDDEPLPLRRSSEGLLETSLPSGEHAIQLGFHRDLAGRVGAWVTMATLLALAVARRVFVRRRRNGGRPGAGPARRETHVTQEDLVPVASALVPPVQLPQEGWRARPTMVAKRLEKTAPTRRPLARVRPGGQQLTLFSPPRPTSEHRFPWAQLGGLRRWWSPHEDTQPIGCDWWARALVIAAAVAYVVLFSKWTLRNHDGYGTWAFDFGIYDQGLWLLSRFKEPFITIIGRNLFGDHTSFILLPLVPVYWIYPSAKVLLIAQAAALGSAAIPAFLIGREKLRSEMLAALVAVAYLLHPALAWTNFEQFHPDVFEVPLLLFAFWFMLKHRWLAFAISVGALLLVKEDVAPLVFVLGLYVAVRHDRRVGLITCAAAVAYFAVALYWILPTLNGVGTLNAWRIPFGGPGGLIRTAFLEPGKLISYLLGDDRPWYAWQMFIPLGGLALLAPSVLVIAIFPLASNLLSTFYYQYHIQYHYGTLILPVLVVATIFAIANARSKALRNALVGLVVCASLVSAYHWGPTPLSRHTVGVADPDYPTIPHLNRAVEMVPDSAVVSAHYAYVPHLDHRERIYMFPNPWKAQYWGTFKQEGQRLPEADDVEYVMLPTTLDPEPKAVFDSIRGEFETVYEAGGVTLVRRRGL